MTRKHLIACAKAEEKRWRRGCRTLPNGVVLAILFAFIHFASTGETVEETFFKDCPPSPEYEI